MRLNDRPMRAAASVPGVSVTRWERSPSAMRSMAVPGGFERDRDPPADTDRAEDHDAAEHQQAQAHAPGRALDVAVEAHRQPLGAGCSPLPARPARAPGGLGGDAPSSLRDSVSRQAFLPPGGPRRRLAPRSSLVLADQGLQLGVVDQAQGPGPALWTAPWPVRAGCPPRAPRWPRRSRPRGALRCRCATSGRMTPPPAMSQAASTVSRMRPMKPPSSRRRKLTPAPGAPCSRHRARS